MKSVIFFTFVSIFLVNCNFGGYETIIIAGEKFEIAKDDFPSDLTFIQANEACENLGNGWRLPTLVEWTEINKQLVASNKGGFDRYCTKRFSNGVEEVFYQGYWSSSRIPDLPKDFKEGIIFTPNEKHKGNWFQGLSHNGTLAYRVRAIRPVLE